LDDVSANSLPDWSSWTYAEEYLPADFHTRTGFNQVLVQFQQEFPSEVSVWVLGVGLALRDIIRQQEMEPDSPLPGTPNHVLGSALNMEDFETLLQIQHLVMMG
jgi:hypothetical protein